MEATTHLNPTAIATNRSGGMAARWMLWTGWGVSALPVLMMLLSASMKLSHDPKMLEMWTSKFGFAEALLVPVALLELTCVLLYAIPRTAVLGAILLTAYLGGAVATHVRVAEAFAIPVVLGVLAWAGLFLRDPRVRDLLPLRKAALRNQPLAAA
jgi:DoxX-like family